MAKPSVLTEQLYTRVKGLFQPTSRRTRKHRVKAKPTDKLADKPAHTPTDNLAGRPAVKNKHAVRLQTANVQPSGQKPPEMARNVRHTASQRSSRDAAPPKASKKGPQNKPQKKAVAKAGTSSFWSDLFLVRPWLLVGGLWLTFIVLISIAWAGLSSPGREMVLAPVTSSIDGQPLSAPDAAAAARLVLPDEDEMVLTQRDPAATLPGASEQSMPVWPLLVMVAACAGGCMLMSKQGLLTAEPRRARRRALEAPVAHRSVRPAGGIRANGNRPTPSRPTGRRNRRSKNRRLGSQRPVSQVMAFRPGQREIQHTPLQTASRSANPVSFAVGHGATTPVTVVPENETSALDWKEGSLAHRLDVRQTRSINSFL
ncbi:hypothetical protein [Leptothoe sp. PORK10 BA2]|uniref:hypothetical protein n=1 Tax=Leptothoe sp. PORK10 BA2 TaxID=3110254 RepID=UPI002B1F270A|nr:hypothetical protein [Leptothoe sp. PORK10 BA2]MEA5466326.1 hypothetical protein [Leptothoe sp. PORK10 BA2]